MRFVDDGGEAAQELDLDMGWDRRWSTSGGRRTPGPPSTRPPTRPCAGAGRSTRASRCSPTCCSVAADRSWWFWGGHHIVADGFTAPMVSRARRRGVLRARGRRAGRAGAARGPRRAWSRATPPTHASPAARARRRLVAGPAGRRPRTRAAGRAPTPPPGRETLRRAVELSAEQDARLRAAANRPGRRPSGIVTAAVAAYLHRVTGAPDLVLGLPVTARSGPRDAHASRGCWPTSCRSASACGPTRRSATWSTTSAASCRRPPCASATGARTCAATCASPAGSSA